MALIVDEIGLLAADRRREEPTHVIRPHRSAQSAQPERNGPTPQPAQHPSEQQAPRMTGHRQMLQVAMQRGMVRSG